MVARLRWWFRVALATILFVMLLVAAPAAALTMNGLLAEAAPAPPITDWPPAPPPLDELYVLAPAGPEETPGVPPWAPDETCALSPALPPTDGPPGAPPWPLDETFARLVPELPPGPWPTPFDDAT